MQAQIKRIFLTFVMAFLMTHILCTLSQAWTNTCGTETHSYYYCGAVDVPYSCCDNDYWDNICRDCGGQCFPCDYADDGCDGNCTWWAWEKACRDWGVGLPDLWWGIKPKEYKKHGYLANKIPAKYTIAVSQDKTHVVWVKEVLNEGGKIFVSEMNCFCGKHKCSNPQDHTKSVRELTRDVDEKWDWWFIYPPLICAKGHFVSPQGTDYGNDPVFLLQNGKYYHIISSDVLDMMEHPNLPRWKWSRVEDISADRLWEIFIAQNYIESGEFITTNSSSNGLLIRQVGTDPVYRVQDGRLQNVSYKECQQNYCWPDIIDVTEDIINFFQEQTLVPFFSQNDVRWAEDQLGDCPSWHIGWIADISDYPANLAGGCATTSKAMVFNYYQPGYTDPGSLNICLTQNSGYAGGCLAPWDDRNNICAPSGVSFAGHVKEKSLFLTIINSELSAGRPVIAQVKTNKIRSHFVVIIGIKGATYYINDPWDLEFVPRTLDNGALGSYEIQALWLYHGPPAIYVPDNYPTIQEAVDAVSPGDTIIVRDGTYTENVDVNKSLTIQSENGADKTIIQAADPNDHVFEVTAGYVNIGGFTVTGATEWPKAGIYLGSGTDTCTISDNNVSNNYYGVFLEHSNNNTLTMNRVNSNHLDGIYLDYSSSNILTNNDANLNGQLGIHLFRSSQNTLTGNTVICKKPGFGVRIYGETQQQYDNSIDTSNLVNGKPVYYYYNIHDQVVSGIDSSHLTIAASTNITVIDNNISNGDGIHLGIIEGCIISNNILSNNRFGIYISCSFGNTIKNNDTQNNFYGIISWASSSNTIANNLVSSNISGIGLGYSSNNDIYQNDVFNNSIGFSIGYSSNNDIYQNDVFNNSTGFSMGQSNDNLIYLNNFIDNSKNIYYKSIVNTWNSPEEITYTYNGITHTNYLGNYWDDYIGSDADGDGIGDTPYLIDSDKDNYPLMERFENYVK